MTPLSNQLSLQKSVVEAYGFNASKTDTGQGATAPSLPSALQYRANPQHNDAVGQEQIALSPRAIRAQRIDAMAKDFFANGHFNVNEMPKLIQRLHQDGILSEPQLTRLSDTGFDLPKPNSQFASLKDFIDRQTAELEETLPDSQLLVAVKEAKTVLAQMDEAQSPRVSRIATRVSAQLNVMLNSDASMTDIDRQQWQGLKSVMQLAASMGDHQLAGGQLNSYLALAGR